MSVIAVKRIFKPFFHFSFPKAAIKSRKAKERMESKEQLKARRKGNGEKTERSTRHKKPKSVKLNGKSFNFKQVKASESRKEIYKNL